MYAAAAVANETMILNIMCFKEKTESVSNTPKLKNTFIKNAPMQIPSNDLLPKIIVNANAKPAGRNIGQTITESIFTKKLSLPKKKYKIAIIRVTAGVDLKMDGS